jgi:hypothetical protein
MVGLSLACLAARGQDMAFLPAARQSPEVSLLAQSAPDQPSAGPIRTGRPEKDARNLRSFDDPTDPANSFSSSGVMSKYVVKEDRIPDFRTRDLYSGKGLKDLTVRRHPGLLVGDILHDNTAEDYEVFLEDERLDNIRDYTDLALAMTVGGDKAEGDAILRAERDSFTRFESSDPLQSWEDAPKTREGTPLILNLEQMRVTWIDVRF